ncbi:hypothetical protein CL689_01760 [Candidatus Saccharibacteria bacterium]|nr:hypothetical protein [Candidatus Saccharibacteria bacterium]MBQ68769.1 hypothetical protein [Candidatus Saccharibacteria bacterium]
MSNDRNQASTRHHFLQRAYLDRFTENGRIDVVLRQTGEARTGQRTNAIANVRGLYTSTDEDGNKDGSLEGAFAQEIEGPAIRIINNAASVFPYVPMDDERAILASYIALQYLRTPEAKRRYETDAGRLAAIEIFNRVNSPKELRKFLKAKGEDTSKKALAIYRQKALQDLKKYTIVPDNNGWLALIAEGLKLLTPILLRRYRWHIFYYESSSLITSDHPVIVRQINKSTAGVGFQNADEIIFPLGKKHCLILTTDPTLGEIVHFIKGEEHVDMLNELIFHGSYLEIYSPPSVSGKFKGRPLGKRAITTMSGGPSEGIEFLNHYSGVLDRDNPLRH